MRDSIEEKVFTAYVLVVCFLLVVFASAALLTGCDGHAAKVEEARENAIQTQTRRCAENAPEGMEVVGITYQRTYGCQWAPISQ